MHVSSSARRELWTDRLRRFRRGSQSVKAFCQAEGVSKASFYQWKQKLAQPAPAEPRFLAVTLDTPAPSSSRVTLPGGANIELSASLSREQWTDLIAAVVTATNSPDQESR